MTNKGGKGEGGGGGGVEEEEEEREDEATKVAECVRLCVGGVMGVVFPTHEWAGRGVNPTSSTAARVYWPYP